MKKVELLELLKNKGISLGELCQTLGLNEYEILSLVHNLREDGINISIKNKDDDLYMYNRGEKSSDEANNYHIDTKDKEFKFVAISDTRFGSKSQQLEILNDIYRKAKELGYTSVIHCGNITEGLYPITNIYAESNFLDDSMQQIDYVSKFYPYVEGITTYFLTGYKDDKHLKTNKINIGKRISEIRSDMIYLGEKDCTFTIDKVPMLVFNQGLEKTYTVSYRPQQQIDSFRSENKPNILLYGGLLQMQKFTYRDVACISVPSVCGTTKEMNDRRIPNTVGAWYVTIKTKSNGKLNSVRAMDSVYYHTSENDYKSSKVLKLKIEE